MDAHKCKICGEKHYGLCPSHQAQPVRVVATRAAEIISNKSSVHAAGAIAGDDSTVPTAASRRSKQVDKVQLGFDRVAYQRDYMRRRRAEQKAKAEIMKQRTIDAQNQLHRMRTIIE